MKRFTATRADRKKASKIIQREIEGGETQPILAEKYDTHQPVISLLQHGHKVSNLVVKTVLDLNKEEA